MCILSINWEPGSSQLSGYGVDNRVIEVRFLAEARDFSSSFCVQTGSSVNPASYTVGAGGPLPRAKLRLGRDADPTPPPGAEVMNG
jgi:hypothetical protein